MTENSGQKMFKIQQTEPTEGKARTGILETAHAKVETPFFMPVATKLTVKHVSPMEIIEMGGQSIISNAYVLYLKPGLEIIKEAGGIHKLMNFPRNIFTDSGGFQMLKESFLIGIDDKTVRFKDPFSGRKHSLSPENVMQIEREIGSDVAMSLDHVPAVRSSKEKIAESVRRTGLWAERCKRYMDDHDGKSIYGKKQLLFGIAQGGLFKDLREKSAKQIEALNFDGIAIGGLRIGENREEMLQALDWQLDHFSKEKPKYLMGVGNPKDIIEAVARGVDCFDSIYPTQNARHCNLITSEGMIKIDKGKYAHDFRPLDPECDCYVCKNFSRAYLHHLARASEWTHHRYFSYHNVYWMVKFMERIRKAIKEGSFEELRKDINKKFK